MATDAGNPSFKTGDGGGRIIGSGFDYKDTKVVLAMISIILAGALEEGNFPVIKKALAYLKVAMTVFRDEHENYEDRVAEDLMKISKRYLIESGEWRDEFEQEMREMADRGAGG